MPSRQQLPHNQRMNGSDGLPLLLERRLHRESGSECLSPGCRRREQTVHLHELAGRMLGLHGSEGQCQQYHGWLEEVDSPFSCCRAAEVAVTAGSMKIDQQGVLLLLVARAFTAGR